MHVIALLLSWLTVSLDCHGRPEAFVTYSVWTERVTQIGIVLCEDGTLACPVYSRTFVEYGTAATSLWLDDPAPGGMIAWQEPVAVDAAGNRSDETCPAQ